MSVAPADQPSYSDHPFQSNYLTPECSETASENRRKDVLQEMFSKEEQPSNSSADYSATKTPPVCDMTPEDSDAPGDIKAEKLQKKLPNETNTASAPAESSALFSQVQNELAPKAALPGCKEVIEGIIQDKFDVSAAITTAETSEASKKRDLPDSHESMQQHAKHANFRDIQANNNVDSSKNDNDINNVDSSSSKNDNDINNNNRALLVQTPESGADELNHIEASAAAADSSLGYQLELGSSSPVDPKEFELPPELDVFLTFEELLTSTRSNC